METIYKKIRATRVLLAISSALGLVLTGSAQEKTRAAERWVPAADVQQYLAAHPTVQAASVNRRGTPTALVGNIGHLSRVKHDITEEDLSPALSGVLPPLRLKKADLKLDRLTVDDLGFTHARYKQFKNGLEVVGSSLSLHVDAKGKVYAATGDAHDGEDLPSVAAVGVDRAFEKADRVHGVAKAAGKGRLVYIITSREQNMHLAWETHVSGTKAGLPIDEMVYVDASTGEVVEQLSNIWYSINRKVYKYAESGAYPGAPQNPPPAWWPLLMYSSDSPLDGSAQYFNQYPPSVSTTCVSNWTYLNRTYSYFLYGIDRVSYDNSDSALVTIVNGFSYQGVNNAGWDTTNRRALFGLGDGTTRTALAADPDVVTHEFAHGVTQTSSNLKYAFESGSLNEAFSDIMAASNDAYANGGSRAATWRLGETSLLNGTADRYMNDPAADGYSYDFYPDYATAKLSLSYSDDYGRVHGASGIANLAFYLLASGGTHPRGKTSVSVPSVGIVDARRIFNRAFVTSGYMNQSSQFIDARMATVQAASDLGLSTTSVNLAWDAVGVPAIGDNNYPINISTRANAGTGDNVLIAGFVLGGGTTAKSMLLRGVGPTLAAQGVTGVMSNPTMTLFQGSSQLGSNDDWSSSANKTSIQQAASAVGAFALPDPSADAAMLQTLGSGVYTLMVSGVAGGTGQAMAEVYDTNPSNPNHLLNISSRCRVSPADPMIAGIVINGTAYKRLLIRAVGPALTSIGVSGAISNPKVKILSGSTTIYENDNWNSNDAAIAAATTKVGASPSLAAGSADAAMLVSLPPGIYTAFAESADGSSGLCLIEVYEVTGRL